MSDSFDRKKMADCMFDPVTSAMIAELEDGEKECSILANAVSITQDEVRQRFDYPIKAGYILERKENDRLFFSANAGKLAKLVETENFDSAISGLEKMDSYLN